MNQQLRDHFYWITALRATATIAVIFLHASGDSLYLFTPRPDSDWWIGNCYDSLVRFCVPVFVMITGALLLPLHENWLSFYKRRLSRILLPFVLWTALYLLLNYALALRHHQVDVAWLLVQLKEGGAYHLWYVYMILALYLLLPLISWLLQRASEKQILFFLAVWTVSLVFHPYPDYWFFGYTGYVVLGYYLNTTRFAPGLKVRVVAIALFITGVLATVFGTYFVSETAGKFEERYYSFLSINVMLAATGIFVLFKNYFSTPQPVKAIVLINKYSYGIYLSHIMVLFFLSKGGFNYNSLPPVMGIPLLTAVTLFISLGLTWLISRLPLGKYVSG